MESMETNGSSNITSASNFRLEFRFSIVTNIASTENIINIFTAKKGKEKQSTKLVFDISAKAKECNM